MGSDQQKGSGDNSSIHKLFQRGMVYLIQQTLSFGGRDRQSNVDGIIKVEVQRKKFLLARPCLDSKEKWGRGGAMEWDFFVVVPGLFFF